MTTALNHTLLKPSIQTMVTLTLVYIAIPTYLFITFWVKPGYAFVSLALITLAFSLIIYNLYFTKENWKNSRSVQANVVGTSALFALGLCFFSEFGAYNYQSYDYLVHNYKFNLLATSSLPLYDQKKDIYMCYYLGYYIVPSLLGAVTKLSLVKYFAFFWTWLGLTISYVWIQVSLDKLKSKTRLVICLLFTVGTYVCIILPILVKYFFPSGNFATNNISINGSFLFGQISILSMGLSSAPQHVLPALLSFAFFMAIIQRLEYFYSLSFFAFCTLFWSPFAVIGMALFYLYFFIRKIQEGKVDFLRKFVPFGLVLLLGFSPVVLYFTSSSASSLISNRFVWQSDSSYWMLYYALYLFTFTGVWFVFFGGKIISFDRKLILLSVLTILLLGLGQMGYYNDLNFRASAPAQLFLALAISYVIVTNYRKLMFKNRSYTLGVLFFILNAASPLNFHYDRLFVIRGHQNTIEKPQIARIEDSYYSVMEASYIHGQEAARQYTLDKASLFQRYLLDE